MRPCLHFILMPVLCLFAAGAACAAPAAMGDRLPNIRSSINDGFYALAEQQARGVLRSGPDDETRYAATQLLAHALWGQKRYSELLALLGERGDRPGYIYWRARARYELKEYDAAMEQLERGREELEASPFAPPALRLEGHILQAAGDPAAAEVKYVAFADRYPDDPDRIDNRFDLAEIRIRRERLTEAVAVYEALMQEPDREVAQRAALRLARLLYTAPPVGQVDTARALLSGLATNAETRLAYRIDAYVDLAALEEQAGRTDAAESALQAAIALSPDARQRVPVKLSLARMRLRTGDTAAALKLLEECRAEVPNEKLAAELQLEKAGALLQAGRFTEAVDACQIYLEVASDEQGMARAAFGKGLALWALGRYTESATALDKAVKGLADPAARADALFKAGDAYYAGGGFADAEKRYRTFTESYPNHENLPNALYQHGLSLAKLERRTEALAVFQRLEQEFAASPFAEKAALRSADVMRAGGQWEAALDKYVQIGQTYTNRTAASVSLHQRGLVLLQLQRYAEAQQAFEQVLADYPESGDVPQATFMRGFCLYYQGKVDEAVEACRAFIGQYPDSEWAPKVIFWLAEQYYNQGGYAEAEPLFLRVAEDFAADPLAPRGLYRAGRCAAARADFVNAIARYNQVARDYPGSDVLPQTLFAHGDALSELGEFSRAILAFDQIIRNHPESHLISMAWGRKGDCHFSLAGEDPARYADAMNSYQAILDRPSTPSWLRLMAEYKLGRCLEKTGVADQAFSRYMNVVYTFINENADHSASSTSWFIRAAIGAAELKEKERDWPEAVRVYERILEADMPGKDAKEEARRRIDRIRSDNWLLFEQGGETGTD